MDNKMRVARDPISFHWEYYLYVDNCFSNVPLLYLNIKPGKMHSTLLTLKFKDVGYVYVLSLNHPHISGKCWSGPKTSGHLGGVHFNYQVIKPYLALVLMVITFTS